MNDAHDEQPAGELAVPDQSGAAASDPLAQPIFTAPDSSKGKFRLAYVLLAVVVAVAAAALVGFLMADRPATSQWSAFAPSSGGLIGAQQIAEHVGSHYQAEDGTQLVEVIASPLSLQDQPVDFIAVTKPDINGRADPLLLPDQNAIEYSLCGDASKKCAITKGQPSPERFRLLSRAGLELALYTFRYLDDVDSVVTFLPPRDGDDPTWALFFRRDQVADYLDEPLERTLAPGTLSVATLPDGEVARIDQLTDDHRFQYRFQQLEDSTPVLVLDEVPAQG